jgi:Fur family peroxide stress response transcriptional regulator
MANKSIIKILIKNDLKVTPQRIAILEVILTLENHPNADNITEYLRISHPNISLGTIYKNLDTFTKKGIIHKVHNYDDSMKYDAIIEKHHHLYSQESDRIEDYADEKLNNIIEKYFKKKEIPNFTIEDINLQIIGRFTDKDKDKDKRQKIKDSSKNS